MDYLERNRDFKGVWIPKDIWLNDNLTMLEKVILVEIDSLDNEDHCVAGNEYLAQFCQCSESKVSGAIKKLQELGYIEVIAFDGRHRRIRSCILESMKQHPKKYEAEPEKVKAISIVNNIDNNLTISSNEQSSSTEKKSTKKKLPLKDQLVNYVASLQFSDDIKQELFGWIFETALNSNVTLKQLQKSIEELTAECNGYESLVKQAISKSREKKWCGFWKPKTFSPATQEKKAPNSLATNPQDNNYSKQPDTSYTKGCWGTQIF